MATPPPTHHPGPRPHVLQRTSAEAALALHTPAVTTTSPTRNDVATPQAGASPGLCPLLMPCARSRYCCCRFLKPARGSPHAGNGCGGHCNWPHGHQAGGWLGATVLLTLEKDNQEKHPLLFMPDPHIYFSLIHVRSHTQGGRVCSGWLPEHWADRLGSRAWPPLWSTPSQHLIRPLSWARLEGSRAP